MSTADRVGVGVPAVNRAIDVLRLLAHTKRPMGVSELGRTLGIPKSSLHAIMRSLSVAAFVNLTPEKKYELGSGLFDLLISRADTDIKPSSGDYRPGRSVDPGTGPLRVQLIEDGEVAYYLSLERAERPKARARYVVRAPVDVDGRPAS